MLAVLFSFFLLLVSFIYGFLIRLILSCYQTGLFKSSKPDCRVISVGNITWGGTGKTPLIEVITRFLKQKGKSPAILIRGYGKDEVYMLKDKFRDTPVLASRDRIKIAQDARKRYSANTIILDDGFQHWRMARDLDIVLIDATCPFGNRRMIPRGMLREPLSSLSRADVFVLTKTDLVGTNNIELIKQELRKHNLEAAIYEARHMPTFLRSLDRCEKLELPIIKNQQIAVISGIASPRSFAQTLTLLGAKISLKFYFPDHYHYSQEDLERIERQCLKQQIETVVTTEKDAAKLTVLLKSKRLKLKLLVLYIELKIVKDEEKFFRFLLSGADAERPYSILVLNDGKAGHLNQSRAVAAIIRKRKRDLGKSDVQVSTEIVEVKFKNTFCRLLLKLSAIFSGPYCRKCFSCVRFCLQKNSFCELMQAPCDIVVSAGSSLASVNLFLGFKNKARKVVLMKPSLLSSNRFDLMITPEHDRVKPKNNVVVTKIAPNLINQQYLQDQAKILTRNCELSSYAKVSSFALRATEDRSEDRRTTNNKGPTIGVLIGGDTAKYSITVELMSKVISQLKQAAESLNCQLLISTSRRTPKMAEGLLKKNFLNFPRCKLLVIANEKNIPEAVGGILGLSDIVVVSGESVSMVSEAVSAQRPVLVFNPEKKLKGLTKQEKFLEGLEKEKILKIVQPENLFSKIGKVWKNKPKRAKIQDRELIYQAISRLI